MEQNQEHSKECDCSHCKGYQRYLSWKGKRLTPITDKARQDMQIAYDTGNLWQGIEILLQELEKMETSNQTKPNQTKENTMKKTLTQYDIAEELMNDLNANWTRAGAFALAEYFEELEEDLGESIEFDRVAIRCDFSQYESLQDWAKDYCPLDWVNFLTYENPDKAIREYIQERGELIEFNGGIIVSSF